MKPFWRTYFSNGWFNHQLAQKQQQKWRIFGSLKQGETCWKHVANINISNTLVKYSMRCSNYDDNLRMIIVENNYASPPVLTKTTFLDDISCLYFQTSKGEMREVISKTPKALRITLKYLILTFEKTKHIPKRQQQTANTHNLQFLSTKKTREKNTFHIGFTVLVGWDFLNWPFFVGCNTTGRDGQFQLRSRSLELSNNPPVGWWKDVGPVVIRFSPPWEKKLLGGFKSFLFSPLVGEDSQFDKYFSNGLKPPTRKHHTCWWKPDIRDSPVDVQVGYLIIYSSFHRSKRWLALGFSEPSTVSGMYIFMCGTHIRNILLTYTYHHLSTFRFFMIQMYTKHVGINIPVQGQQLKLEAEQLNVWRIENSFYCKIMFYHPLLL